MIHSASRNAEHLLEILVQLLHTPCILIEYKANQALKCKTLGLGGVVAVINVSSTYCRLSLNDAKSLAR